MHPGVNKKNSSELLLRDEHFLVLVDPHINDDIDSSATRYINQSLCVTKYGTIKYIHTYAFSAKV